VVRAERASFGRNEQPLSITFIYVIMSPSRGTMSLVYMSFFTELKRRNVIRVALLYAIAGWIILQVTNVGVSLLHIQVWTGKMILVLLAVGFPLALVFSWLYEITPAGIRKATDVEKSRSIVDKTASKLNCALIVLFVLALTGLVVDRFLPDAPIVAHSSPQ
jgi:hypothetical protein